MVTVTLKQIREKIPGAEVLELDPTKKYIILYNVDAVSRKTMESLNFGLPMNHNAAIVGVYGNPKDVMVMFEIEKENP